jgi:hypothetical protein
MVATAAASSVVTLALTRGESGPEGVVVEATTVPDVETSPPHEPVDEDEVRDQLALCEAVSLVNGAVLEYRKAVVTSSELVSYLRTEQAALAPIVNRRPEWVGIYDAVGRLRVKAERAAFDPEIRRAVDELYPAVAEATTGVC